ncbi:MAG: solute carrier family 26 protein [Myxococcales bacterium]|nr:solute carrier family 26 protein [Myxococcales bacterium]
MNLTATLRRTFPILGWLPNYDRSHLGGDVAAGLTTAVMLIPQAMAYAMLAGLPPVVGLYASMVPLVVYAALGTSRQLAVGPVAMVSLLVASGVGALAEPGSTDYVTLAVTTALTVGILQTVMGGAKLGFLVNFLSHPVVSGFTSAAALIIGLSQLKHLMGVNIPRSHHVHTIVLTAIEQVADTHVATLLIGALSVVALVLLKRFFPKFPRALLVVSSATVAVWLLGLDTAGVAIVGAVPSGLPMPSLPDMSLTSMMNVLPTALTIALVGFMESISVAKGFARRHGYALEPNQELIGLGMANVAGSFFGAYPVTGGFSRTAVNAQAGAKTGLAAIITAGVIALALLFLTPLLHFLPKATLAAIIMTAVAGLIDFAEVKHLWQADRKDLALLALTFFATLGLGIEQGILTGVAASMVWFVFETTKPHAAELGRLPTSPVWRNLDRHPSAKPVPGVVAVRIDSPLYYGNVTFLKATIERLLDRNPTPTALVMDFSPVHALDSSAANALAEIKDELAVRGIALHLTSVRGPVRDTMARAHLDTHIGSDCVHECIDGAMRCICGPDWSPALTPSSSAAPVSTRRHLVAV